MGLFDADNKFNRILEYEKMLKEKEIYDKALLRANWSSTGVRGIFATRNFESYTRYDFIQYNEYDWDFENHRNLNRERTITKICEFLNSDPEPIFLISEVVFNRSFHDIMEMVKREYGEKVMKFFSDSNNHGII